MKPVTLLDLVAPLTPFERSGYGNGGDSEYYSAESLYAQAKKEKARPYRFLLRGVDFSESVWRRDGVRLADYAFHARRALATDTSIPIIVGPLGGVMDGYHRILRALLDGRTYVMALRLQELPEPGVDPDKKDKNG